MIPTRRLLALLLGWTLLGLVASVWPKALLPWRSLGWVILGLVLVDALGALWPRRLAVERHLPSSLAVGVWKEVRLTLRNPSYLSAWIETFDHHPLDFEARGLPQRHRVPARGYLELTYELCPLERGRHLFGPVQMRVEGFLGLLAGLRRRACPQEVKVFPDFAAVAHYALLATDNRLSALGILRRPRRGEGMDFHQLREFRTGDSLRRIDWKATARTRKLISREYQDERDQQVVFLLDCGRRMRALDELGGRRLGHFDQALNAMFLLSFVALKQGDAVGVATFAEAQPRMLAPRKGLAALDHLFQGLFDLQPTTQASDYLEAARRLRDRLRKRSLVVMLTNLRDEEDDTLTTALELLRSRHLVLVASLREVAVDRLLAKDPQDLGETLVQAAAQEWKHRRESLILALAHRGTAFLDVAPEHLPTALVNRYLEMKTSGVF